MENVDLRDRLARSEQNHLNLKENFQNFKADDFGSLKREVHAMRGELNHKIDQIIENQNLMRDVMSERMQGINLVIAKWTGALGVVIFIGEFALKKFLGA